MSCDDAQLHASQLTVGRAVERAEGGFRKTCGGESKSGCGSWLVWSADVREDAPRASATYGHTAVTLGGLRKLIASRRHRCTATPPIGPSCVTVAVTLAPVRVLSELDFFPPLWPLEVLQQKCF